MISSYRRQFTVLVLTLAFLSASCGGFAQNLRLTLALSGPLIDSLVSTGAIPASLKAGLITDFVELGNGAATLKQDLDACADKPCKLNAVEKYERLLETVAARGHFGAHARLQNIQTILRGIVEAARIYYGGTPTAGMDSQPITNPKAAIEQRLDALKAAMKP